MQELEKLKAELKRINQEASRIREVAAEQRAEVGKRINAQRQKVLVAIQNAQKRALDVDVKPLDVTAWCGVYEDLPEFYSAEIGSQHPLTSEIHRLVGI